MRTIEDDIKDRLDKKLITSELEPIKCGYCNSKTYNDKVTDYMGPIVVEKDRICENCKTFNGFVELWILVTIIKL